MNYPITHPIGANLLLIGYLWSFALNGWAGLAEWQRLSCRACARFIKDGIKALSG